MGVFNMAQTVEECSKLRNEVLAQVELNSDLQVIKNFNNEHQVKAYEFYTKKEIKKLGIEKIAKTLTKIATVISAVSGAIAIIIEALLPII